MDPRTLDNLVQARSGGRVERCHAIPHVASYNNASHSWGVALLMWYLWPEDFPRLAIHCLVHDVPESWVGDIPATTLRYVPGIRSILSDIEGRLNRNIGLPGEDELSEEDHQKLKACDRLELYMWCREQRLLGNWFAEEVLRELERFFKRTPLHGRAAELYKLMESNQLLPRQSGVMEEVCQ